MFRKPACNGRLRTLYCVNDDHKTSFVSYAATFLCNAHAPESGVNIRILAGFCWVIKSVTTTQIYTHVMQKPGLGVKSPLDSL